MSIETELYEAAVALIELRYPARWGGAAAIRTKSGKILTSVAPDTKNDGLSLCMEVGAYLEAHKLDEAVTHSLCICQERLVHWGGGVKVAVSSQGNELVFKELRELMPHHWSLVNGEVL